MTKLVLTSWLSRFLPDSPALNTKQVEATLTNAFRVPSSFWKPVAKEASGFFGSRGVFAGEREAEISCKSPTNLIHVSSIMTKLQAMFYRFGSNAIEKSAVAASVASGLRHSRFSANEMRTNRARGATTL